MRAFRFGHLLLFVALPLAQVAAQVFSADINGVLDIACHCEADSSPQRGFRCEITVTNTSAKSTLLLAADTTRWATLNPQPDSTDVLILTIGYFKPIAALPPPKTRIESYLLKPGAKQSRFFNLPFAVLNADQCVEAWLRIDYARNVRSTKRYTMGDYIDECTTANFYAMLCPTHDMKWNPQWREVRP